MSEAGPLRSVHVDTERTWGGGQRQVAWLNSPSGALLYPPVQDTPGDGTKGNRFGSAHSTGLNMAMCDGSVSMASYAIEPEVFRRLGNRQDGYAIDGKKL